MTGVNTRVRVYFGSCLGNFNVLVYFLFYGKTKISKHCVCVLVLLYFDA